VTLHELHKLTNYYGVKINLFTIDTGYKGIETKNNIDKILEFEGLEKNHIWINITNDEKLVYKKLIENNQLPCGKICNQIINNYYINYLQKANDTILITGGDTPKYNPLLKRYSIFWKKLDFDVLRGSAAFGLTKEKIKKIKEQEKIPWKNPGCGGYDTDCLIPGFVLRNIYNDKEVTLEQIKISLPIIIDYFSERIRWNLLTKEEAIKRIINLEVSNDNCYEELTRVIKNNSN
jgi:hypothetical protein